MFIQNRSKGISAKMLASWKLCYTYNIQENTINGDKCMKRMILMILVIGLIGKTVADQGLQNVKAGNIIAREASILNY